MKRVLLLAFVSLFGLVGCGDGIDYMAETGNVYAPVPVVTVHVSDRPPKGQYEVIGVMSTQQDRGELPTELVKRLRDKAAAMGGNYVWVVSANENQYVAPAVSSTFSNANANAAGQGYVDPYGNYEGTGYANVNGASTTYSMPAHTYSLVGTTAKVLRVTGNNDPDKTKPSSITGQLRP